MNDGGERPAARIATADRVGGIRIITFTNPPANALSFALSRELIDVLAAANADAAIRAIVFTGASGLFSLGADIADFASEAPPGTLTIRDVVDAVEHSTKLHVAAIDGHALGGAFELALTCDYRLGARSAKVGLPEIKLGLLPGAGGTQRLPRLIGAQAALTFMLAGDTMGADDALAKGLLDEVVDGDVVAAAIALIERIGAAAPRRRLSARKTELGVSGVALFATPFIVAQAHKSVPAEANGGFAAHKLIDAVEASIELEFRRGLAREARLFDELVHSAPSAALRHLFFAERHLGKIPGLASELSAPIARAGVIGAGTMGTGIAITFATAGIPVTVIEPNDAAVERSKQTVFGMFAHRVKRGRLTQEDAWQRARSISWETDYRTLTDVDIVIEAVVESIEVKKQVFAALDAACKPATIFASNTSTLNIDEMAAATQRADRFIGLHFFAPANIMKLLEIVRGAQTSGPTLRSALTLGKRLRKVAIVSANAFGFIGNRMFFDYAREALTLLDAGCAPQRIDRVMKEHFGFAMGPFATFDLSGIDVFWHIAQARPDVLGERRTRMIDRLYAAGRWGQKSGRGFYRYDAPNQREPVPDPEFAALVADEMAHAGIAPRAVSDGEIIERLVYALVNSGADLLEAEVALRPGDEDIAYVYGYGFPAYRGGPMWYADEIGIARVVERMNDFGWTVSPLLRRIAERGGTLADFRHEPIHA